MRKRGSGPDQRGREASSDRGNGPSAPVIPDKLYFRIGEVARLCHVPTYVLRFWQTEFAQLRPGKSGTGQRLYRRRDVEMALRIKHLLHDEGYTIAGAKGVLADESAVAAHLRLQPELPLVSPAAGSGNPAGDPSGERVKVRLQQVRQELRELLGLLDRKPAHKAGPAAPALLFPVRSSPPDSE